MFHPVSCYIGWRYLRGRSGNRFGRFVSTLSTLGIIIGVLSLITVLSVMNGFEKQLKHRILTILPHASLSASPTAEPAFDLHTPPNFIKQYPDVLAVRSMIETEVIIQGGTQLSAGLLLGVPTDEADPISQDIVAGQWDSIQAGSYHILLGYRLARALNVQVGERIRLLVTQSLHYTPFGALPRQRTFTVTGIFNASPNIDDQLMLTHQQDAARLLGKPLPQLATWRLFLTDPFVVDSLAQLPLPTGWQWHDWRDQRGEFFQAVKMEKHMMGLMLGLIIAIATFNIISALIMLVMEKQAEVAILRTQGLNRRQIMAIFMIQGGSSAVVGACFGGVFGVLLANNLNTILQSLDNPLMSIGETLPIVIEPTQVTIVICATILLSVLATLYPSYRASSIAPAEVLRYE